ncbi:MAG: hypothetical protein R2708_19705 [Vicinamibacterales bacterium]
MSAHLGLLLAEGLLAGSIVLLLFGLRRRLGMAPRDMVLALPCACSSSSRPRCAST